MSYLLQITNFFQEIYIGNSLPGGNLPLGGEIWLAEFHYAPHKKWSFPLRFFSVNVTKLWIWSHLLKKSVMENFIFVQWRGNSYRILLSIYNAHYCVFYDCKSSALGEHFKKVDLYVKRRIRNPCLKNSLVRTVNG